MRLLVTGAAGMLGRDVVAAAESAGHDVIALARRDLDIADPAAVRAAVAAELDVHPQTVRYRVKQLRELFGERLEDPEARFELSLALRAG